MNKLSSYRNFEFQAIIKSNQPSLDDFFGEGPRDGTLSSLNVLAAKLMIEKLERIQTYQGILDKDKIAELRDQLAEIIEQLESNTSLPNDLSQQLMIFAAIEEEIAGKTPLVEQYCDKIENIKTSNHMVYDNVLSSVILFMRRYTNVIVKFDELLQKTTKLRNDYLEVLMGNNVEDDKDEELEPLSIDERNEFESFLLMLEIPEILYNYLQYYYGLIKESNNEIVYLNELAKELYDRDFKSFSLLPRELSRIIPRIEKRLVRNINFIDNIEFLQDFLFNKKMFELWPPQLDAIKNFQNLDSSYFIYQPTSSGKSLIAEIWIFLHLLKNPDNIIIYLVSMKSLASQVSKDLSQSFSSFVVSNLSGVQLHPILDTARKSFSNILIMTPEKFNLLYQNGEFNSNHPSTIIIDEAHGIMGKNTREFTNSISILKFKLKYSNIPILALSAVIEQPDSVEKWGYMNFKLQGSEWRSTRLKTYTVDVKQGLIESISKDIIEKTKLETLFKRLNNVDHTVKLFEFLEYRSSKQLSLIVFCNSRSDTIKYAEAFYNKYNGTQKNEDLVEFIREELGEDDNLNKFVTKGIAYHHAGLPPNVKNKIEESLKLGKLKIICATTTLAEGLNTPVDVVIIPKPYLFTGNYNEPMLLSTINNMFGRAGRASHGGIGKSFIYTDDFNKHLEVKSKPKITFASNFEEVHPVLLKSLRRNELPTANYSENEILKFRTSIYSLVCDGAINSKNVNRFINKIDPIRKDQFKVPIQKTVTSFKKIPELLMEHSPLQATELGWLCFRTGLDPLSFTNYIKFIEEIKEDISFIEHTTFLNLSLKQRRKLLKIFFIPDEARIDGNNLIEPEYRIKLLDCWLFSNGSLQLTKKKIEEEIGSDFDLYKISTTIFDTFGNTITWISWAFNQIIEFHFDMDVDSSYSLLPFYIKSGRTDPFYAILSGFNLSKTSIQNYLPLLPKTLQSTENVSELFEWIVYELPKLIEQGSFEDNELNALLFKSLRSPKEWDQSVFLASFISGWYDLSLNALKKSKINVNSFEKCLDNILFTSVDYADKLNEMKIENKIKNCYKLLNEKKNKKSDSILKIFFTLLEYFPKYNSIINM
ncbi:MAG: DEAD/DEAH box helicase [Candidatus Heimdallarchaeota archaeon]|nr:DEAD/DEAH box helicase [Candidatus Heimdallarchaeota archaeon]